MRRASYNHRSLPKTAQARKSSFLPSLTWLCELITGLQGRRLDGLPQNLEDVFIQGTSTFYLRGVPSKNEKGLDEIEVLTLLLPLSDSRTRDRNVRPFPAKLGRDIRPTMSSNFA